MRIIFMGTPDFAVASLEALMKAEKNVVAVVTGPDRPAGRGRKIRQTAVKAFALAHNIPILQPEKLKDPTFLEQLASFQADLQVVVAFRMLPEVVWNMPKRGTINVHASLLPQYRGAAPIQHALMNGESETGVTTFKLKHEIDTGDILLQKKTPIEVDDTAGDLHDRLMKIGAELLIETVNRLEQGDIAPIPQEQLLPLPELKQAAKIFREDTEIDWRQSSLNVYNKVRGLSPYPGAFTHLDGKVMKIFRTDIIREDEVTADIETRPGDIRTDGKTYLHMAASDGWLEILELQLEGKRRMSTGEFLRGVSLV